MPKAFVSWSGGKDCSLACYRAMKSGLDIRCLLNMVTEDGGVSRSHGIAARWLGLQAQAMGIPLRQQRTSDAAYEAEFKAALGSLKNEGITDGVFGDIDFDAHREWVERVCSESGIVPHLPLWGEDQSDLMREFINSGFQAIVVADKADLMGKEWLGRQVDTAFLSDLAKIPGITPCGEAGEYHTLVIDGPTFRKKLVLGETRQALRDGHWFLDILGCRLQDKT